MHGGGTDYKSKTLGFPVQVISGLDNYSFKKNKKTGPMVNAQLLPVVGWMRREPDFLNAGWSPKHPPEYFNTKKNHNELRTIPGNDDRKRRNNLAETIVKSGVMRIAFGKLRKIISGTRAIIPESEGMAMTFCCALGTENENSGYGREPQHFGRHTVASL